MVMRELPKPKPAYVLFRGQYDQHREEVYANTPAVLPPMAAGLPRNRLGLARWLTDRGHPLTAQSDGQSLLAIALRPGTRKNG